MGQSSSSSRRRNDHHHRRRRSHHRQNQPLPESTSSPPSDPPPSSYASVTNAPYPTPPPPRNPYPTLPSPVPPPPLSYHPSNNYPAGRLVIGPTPTYYSNQPSNGSWALTTPPPLPPPYVDHQSAKKIKNDVNVQKETIKIQLDENNPDCYLVSFTFDASVEGSITIFYFAKEGANCIFTPLYPEITPTRIPFQKGVGQKFYQPSGSGIDLGFFETNHLAKPAQGDAFPLVIAAESCLPTGPVNEHDEPSPHAQITQAVLEKNNEDDFQVRVVKQILWVDGVRYELREIYGLSNLDDTTTNGDDSGKECVICMTEPKDTAVLPCRHMCLCSECAKELRFQSNNCPICRQPIEELIEIKANEVNSSGQSMHV